MSTSTGPAVTGNTEQARVIAKTPTVKARFAGERLPVDDEAKTGRTGASSISWLGPKCSGRLPDRIRFD
jgi:hypothetical protein